MRLQYELLAKAESHLIQTGGGDRTNIRAHLSDRDGRLTVTASRFIPLEAAAGREAGMRAVLEQRALKLGTVSSQRWPRTTGAMDCYSSSSATGTLSVHRSIGSRSISLL